MFIESLLLVLGIPVGLYIAWLSYDELVMGRKYLIVLGTVSLLLAVLMQQAAFFAGMWTGLFMVIVVSIGIIQSYNPSWTRKKYSTITHKKPGDNEKA